MQQILWREREGQGEMTAVLKIGDFVETVPQAVMAAPMPKLWYMLRLHPNYDLKAERQLHERGISAYVPKESRVVRGVWNRKVLRTVPMFPGCMFIPDFDADIGRIKRYADGIGGFIKFAGEAIRISLRTMEEVRTFETRINTDPEKRKFAIGQNVRIVGGSFDMWEGRIERLDSRYRLSVLIEIFGARSSVQLDEDQVEAV